MGLINGTKKCDEENYYNQDGDFVKSTGKGCRDKRIDGEQKCNLEKAPKNIKSKKRKCIVRMKFNKDSTL